MADTTRISSFGFARGVVVRQRDSERNMLVVRGLDETTACVVCEGDAAGTLRLREFPTNELRQMRIDDEPIDQIVKERDELVRLFDLEWAADMRAVKRWREEAPGRELVLPDRTNLVVWLLEKLEAVNGLPETPK